MNKKIVTLITDDEVSALEAIVREEFEGFDG